jgi:hypothetical protein
VQRDLLTGLLQGYKSRELVPMTLDNGYVRARIEGRIALMPSDGALKLMVWGVKHKPALDRPFMGHVFSVEDRRNLLESGNMGRTVGILNEGEMTPHFISRDRLTNDLFGISINDVYFPKEIQKVELSEHEINELREGRAIKLEWTSDKGKDHTAMIQISAERRGIEYIYGNNGPFNAESLGGKKLTQDERDRLKAGETVLIEDMVGKESGIPYDRFVKLDPETGRPQYYSFNPDSPENARQIIIPKELGGIVLSQEDRLDLQGGKVIHVTDMVSQRGENLPPFVRLDMRTGRVQYSYDPNKFDEKPRFEVPQMVHNVQLTATQRAQLQDGKAVKVDGIVARDGNVISQYVKVNKGQTHLEFSNDNPDARRERSQRSTNFRQTQDNRQSRGRAV